MKILRDILKDVDVLQIRGSKDIPVTAITFDSRKVSKGSAFVAVKGTTADGHSFIPQAISAGAEIVICENLPPEELKTVTYVKVNDSARALG